MISRQLKLNEQQLGSFDLFLINGTGRVLNALETMYEFDIEQYDSNIEIGPANDSEVLKRINDGVLYTFSSALLGEMQGSIQLMMRSIDFDYMSELMLPVLSLLFLSNPDTDLKTLNSKKPDWMNDSAKRHSGDVEFYNQLIDTMAEMGNVLIGLYTKAIYEMCALNTHHSMPKLTRNPKQRSVQEDPTSAEKSDQLALVIENEFHVGNKPLFLWCVITFTKESLKELLDRIACSGQYQRTFRVPRGPVQNHWHHDPATC